MRPTLATLPVELLTAIAYELAVANQPEPSPPTDLIPLLLASSYFYNHLSLEHNTPLYARILHATWDTAACSRRFGRDVLRDSRVAAEDLRARWVLVQGVKTRGALGFPGELGSEEQRELVRQDLVAIYLLLTENDGRNLPIVLLWANLPQYIIRNHLQYMLPTALSSGYPVDSIDKALHITISQWLDETTEEMRVQSRLALEAGNGDGAGVPMETEEEIDEKLFILRPYAIAVHKYYPYFAPWDMGELPVTESRQEREIPEQTDGLPISSLITPTTISLTRFGRDWEMRSPILTLQASVTLLGQLDRIPTAGGLAASSSNSSTANLNFLYSFDDTTPINPLNTPTYNADSDTHLRRSVPCIQLSSTNHDLDVLRLFKCLDPLKGKGMKGVGSWRGKVEGNYHGSFAFFDFNGYREMLRGNQRSLYESTFGQQAQEITIYETVVRTLKSHVGGTGPYLNAGFPEDDEPPDPYTPYHSREAEDEEEPEDSRYTKEIILSGSGKSMWGNFRIIGRVRAWDGLVVISKEYINETINDPATPGTATRGRWLYRGYIQSDSRWVGMWRDTFTPLDCRGYEGAFSMRKQSEPFLLPSSEPVVSDLGNSPSASDRHLERSGLAQSSFQANSLDAFELGKRTTLFSDWRDESALDRSTLTPAIPRPTNLSRPFASLVGTDLIAAEKNVVEGVQGVRLPWTASPDQEDAKSLHLESRQMSGPSSLLSTDRSALDADLARAKASASRKGKGVRAEPIDSIIEASPSFGPSGRISPSEPRLAEECYENTRATLKPEGGRQGTDLFSDGHPNSYYDWSAVIMGDRGQTTSDLATGLEPTDLPPFYEPSSLHARWFVR